MLGQPIINKERGDGEGIQRVIGGEVMSPSLFPSQSKEERELVLHLALNSPTLLRDMSSGDL